VRGAQAFRLVRRHAGSGIGRVHNIAVSSLPGYTLPGDVSASNGIGKTDLIDPPVESLPWHDSGPHLTRLGYHVRHDLIERWTVEKETWRAR